MSKRTTRAARTRNDTEAFKHSEPDNWATYFNKGKRRMYGKAYMVVMILSIGLIMVSDWFALIPVGMALFGLTWIKKRIEVIVNEANDAG